jgi:2-polyprenyl-3-methyl-5-hydroxy-6-metoxy-1,4-benzoquinol methylase
MDVREHLYATYTTAQSRLSSLDDLRHHAKAQFPGLRASILPHLPSNRDARILDAGCGYGALLLLMQEEGYTNANGIDISKEQVEVAKALGLANVQQGDILSEASTRGPWDAIVMLDVIEHLTRSELLTLLHGLYSHLKPGGVFLARTPNVDGVLGTVLSFGDFTHELHLNLLSAQELFAATPFSDVAIYGIAPVDGSAMVRIVRRFLKPITRVVMRLAALSAGISSHMFLLQPNMLIVARKR